MKAIPIYKNNFALAGCCFRKIKYEIIPHNIPNDTIDMQIHVLAFIISSRLITKYAIIAPINPNRIGIKYHHRDRVFSGYIVIVENSSPIYFLQVFSEFV